MVLGHWRRAMGAASVGVALFALTLAPASAAETTITQVVTGSNRTVEASQPTFSAVVYSNTEARTSDATITLTAEDLSGTNSGWNVTLQQTTDLTTTDGKVLARSNVAVNTLNTPTVVNGQAIDAAGGPKVGEGTGALDDARKVMTASSTYGKGRYAQAVDLRITIPAMTLAGSYQGTLTSTIAVGP